MQGSDGTVPQADEALDAKEAEYDLVLLRRAGG